MQGPPSDTPPHYDELAPMRNDLMSRQQAQAQGAPPPPSYDSLGGSDSSHDFGGPPSDAPPSYDAAASNPYMPAYSSAERSSFSSPPSDAPPAYSPASGPPGNLSTPYTPSDYLQDSSGHQFDFSKAESGQAYGSDNPYGYSPANAGGSAPMYPPPQSQYPQPPSGSQNGNNMYAQPGPAPYQGLAPPPQQQQQQAPPSDNQLKTKDQYPVQAYPGAQQPGFVYQGAPPQQVNVHVEHHHYSPLSYGSSFSATIRSFRHNKFVSIGSHFEIGYTGHPTQWNFILSDSRDSYYIVGMWQGAPSQQLHLKVAPTPFFWRANRLRKWEVERSFGVTTNAECEFYLENHGGQFAFRNKASGKFLCAESHCLRADRDSYKDWEKFSIEVTNLDQSLTVLTPYGPVSVQGGVALVDLVLTYHVAFRAKVIAKRYSAPLGLKRGKVTFSSDDCVWEFLPHPSRNAYFIRNADHPDEFWHCTARDTALRPTHTRHEVESAFKVDFSRGRYFFKSVATQKYGSADGSRVVFNRDKADNWEAFEIIVLHQLD